jgi:hypothetical protein
MNPSQVGGMMPMAISPFDAILMGINTNPYFIGIMMLILNFGGRFISLEMSKGQEALFTNTWVRRSLIFIIIFVGTRNILVAFIMTFVIILCMGYLFNENSSLCLFKKGLPGSTCLKENFIAASPVSNVTIPPPPFNITSPNSAPSIPIGGLTKEESEILTTLQKKAALSDVKPKVDPAISLLKNKSDNSISNYFDKMNMLQGLK